MLSDFFTSQEILNIGRNKFDQGQKVRVDLESSADFHLDYESNRLNWMIWIKSSELIHLNQIICRRTMNWIKQAGFGLVFAARSYNVPF